MLTHLAFLPFPYFFYSPIKETKPTLVFWIQPLERSEVYVNKQPFGSVIFKGALC